MDLTPTRPFPTRLLHRLAARRPHVLLVVAPGAPRTRLALETAVARRRWVVAGSPADADVLVLAGTPGPRLQRVAGLVWAAVPAPRVRVRVRAPGDVGEALDGAAARLARSSSDSSSLDDLPAAPMADLATDDRDGLALDALHVPLGPVLPGWPPGLVVHAVLAGDLITEATAEVLDTRPGTLAQGDGLSPDAARLDALARVLSLAGADRFARRARALQDGGAGGADPADRTGEELARFGRRVARARTLHATLRGIPLPPDDAADPGDTDVAGRVRRWAAALGTGARRDPRPDAADAVAALVGLEIGAARLALAALDPDTSRGPAVAPAHGRTAARG